MDVMIHSKIILVKLIKVHLTIIVVNNFLAILLLSILLVWYIGILKSAVQIGSDGTNDYYM